MKKLLFILTMSGFSLFLLANPVAFSGPKINELLWDANGNWQLEIKYILYEALYAPVDSVVLVTPNFRYTLHLPFVESHMEQFYTLNRDSTNQTFDINADGDSLAIYIYADGYFPPNHELVFGNFANAVVPKPEPGQSIVLLEGTAAWFTLDNSPTPGYANDLDGATGSISGTIFHNGKPISSSRTFCFDFYFMPQSDGSYQAACLPGTRTLTQIGRTDQWEEGELWFAIEPLSLSIEREQSYQNVDIVITDTNYVGISKTQRAAITCYPNPASSKIFIQGEFSGSAVATLSDMKGTAIKEFLLDAFNTSFEFQIPENLQAGIYLLSILEQNKAIYNQKIIVNSFK